jgi:[acyl-carrier-protein] S-malonyltransferase
MALDLYETSAAVRDLFSLASEVCETDLYDLLENGTPEDLQDTAVTQPVVTLASRASYIRLRESGVSFLCHGGFSLGELAAYAGGGIFDDRTLFSIVRKRGLLMAKAGEEAQKREGELGMAAVIGLGFAQVERLLAAERLEGLFCANDNGPRQVVISGRKQMIAQARQLLTEHGARKVIPLRVSGPFHTPFMEEATAEFSAFLASQTFFDPTEPVVSSVVGKPVASSREARELLSRQLASPLRWTATMQTACSLAEGKDGVTVGELGAKPVLSGLWKSSGLPFDCRPLGSEEEIMTLKKEQANG